MIERLFTWIIVALKSDPEYKVKTKYSIHEMCVVLYYRLWQTLRGTWTLCWLGRGRLPIFCGRRVIIEHAYKVCADRCLILEDGVYVNAMSDHGIHLGRNVTIGKGAVLMCTGVVAWRGVGITIGNNSAVGAQSFIGGQGGVAIGNDVIMGPGVRIFSEDHNFARLDVPIRLQGERRIGVAIGDNCWIGAGVTIVDGVQLGSGCVIAAGAVVTKNAPPNSVLGGVPATLIRPRA